MPDDNPGLLRSGNLVGLIGNGVLRRLDFTLDFAGKRMYYRRNLHFNEPFEHSSVGLGLVYAGPDLKTVKVMYVSKVSPAAKAGFRVGDVLVQIDDRNLSALRRDDIRDLFLKPGLHHVLIRREDQNTALEFEMKYASAG